MHCHAQQARVSHIEIYGNRTLTRSDLLRQLALTEGGAFEITSFDRTAALAAIRKIPGVSDCDITVTCCDNAGAGWLLYVGISENPAAALLHRKNPRGSVRLPAQIVSAGRQFDTALLAAVRLGNAGEDDSLGYSLMHYGPARSIQLAFRDFARQRSRLLERVLLSSADPAHRTLAAQVVAYSPSRKAAIKQLLYAVSDSDENVRNNATRALAVLARYMNGHPEENLTIPADTFIHMLNSVIWTDRNKATLVLEPLTVGRDAGLIGLLRQQALHSLAEMAMWRSTGHAAMPLLILGRMADVPDSEIFETMNSEAREEVVQKWVKRVEASNGTME